MQDSSVEANLWLWQATILIRVRFINFMQKMPRTSNWNRRRRRSRFGFIFRQVDANARDPKQSWWPAGMVRCRLQCYCSAFASAAHGARRSSGAEFWMFMKHSGMANDCAFLLRLQNRIGGDVNFALTRLREQQGVLATPANDGPRRDPSQNQFPLISRAILTDLTTFGFLSDFDRRLSTCTFMLPHSIDGPSHSR